MKRRGNHKTEIHKKPFWLICFIYFFLLSLGCTPKATESTTTVGAKDILGNPDYQAISYGGYRSLSRETQPTIDELKEDLILMSAIGIKVLRTYNVNLPHAPNVLKAIRELKAKDPNFEMYVMLGAWIDCENAWTDKTPNHDKESPANAGEIEKAVALANDYKDIVKIVAVGNEAMVKWATPYYVQPAVILKWVNHLQDLKSQDKLPQDLWITSSDNFASWGGGSADYHTPELEALIKSVDYISVHTYPMHDTHYNPSFWGVSPSDTALTLEKKVDHSMERAFAYAKSQYYAVEKYMKSLGVVKPIHIGETGWASYSDGFYGPEGSKACDEFKQALYHEKIRSWANEQRISCFFFEAFNEPWKDAKNPSGSENHFGLFTVNGEAKYLLWDEVDKGVFEGLSRNGQSIKKTYNGNIDTLMKTVYVPKVNNNLSNVDK